MSELKQIWVLDSSGTSKEVNAEMRDIWADNELGNDNYFYPFDASDIYCDYVDGVYQEIGTFGDKYPHINKVLNEAGLTECWLRFWW